MFFLKHIHNQLVRAGRIAKDLADQPDVLTSIELHSATQIQRIKSIKTIVKEILTFHETTKVVRDLQGSLDDEPWRYVMKERAGYSKRKDYFDPQTLLLSD